MLSLLSLLSPQLEKVREVRGGLSNESGRLKPHDRRFVVVASSVVDGASVEPFRERLGRGRGRAMRNEGASVEKRFAFSAKLAEPGLLGLSRFRLLSLVRSVFSLVGDALLRLFCRATSSFS